MISITTSVCVVPVSTTAEFRRARARLAANTRFHPERENDDRLLVDAASRERKLREVLGAPPEGSTWLDHFQQMAGKAPLLTAEQKANLALLLGSVRGNAGARETGQ